MSVKMMGAVWELELTAPKLLVLLALADHADHNGENIFPRVRMIAWKTGYSDRQVQRIIAGLVNDGILQTVAAKPGKTKVYRIDLSRGVKKSPLDKVRQNVTPDTIVSPLPLTSDVTPTPDITVSPITINTTIIEKEKTPAHPPNAWYDAIKAVWGFTESYNGEIAKMLQGCSTRKGFVEYNLARDSLTPDDLRAWGRWYRTTELNGDPNLHMLEDRMKIQSSITAWLERRQRKAADDQRRALADQQWQEMHPELYSNPLRRDVAAQP